MGTVERRLVFLRTAVPLDLPVPDDCDDGDATVHPMAVESCDAIDSNYDGDLIDGFLNTDGDGEADCIDTDDDNDQFPDSVDCDPLDASIYPGAAELCDGLDSDCDGSLVDEFSAVMEIPIQIVQMGMMTTICSQILSIVTHLMLRFSQMPRSNVMI